ncbi:MAG: acyl-CoA dehydrogenase family protein [Sciscionella sp.]
MDFTLGEELLAVRDLAAEIFADRATAQRVREVEESESRVDGALWSELTRAGLLGVALPEPDGGAGLGLGALCVLLTEQGRTVAPVPVWPAVAGALAVAEHGTPEQRATVVAGTAEGSVRLTVALEEFGPADPERPSCLATPDGDAWRLTGTKAVVPSAFGADHVLVAASTERGTGLFLVPSAGTGVGTERVETTSHDAAANLTLDGAAAKAVGEPGNGVLEWTLRQVSTAVAAVQLGVAEGALAHAANYLRDRAQFGRPLGSFQAVQHQLADCYIDIDAMRVTLWRAVTALADGDPAADRAVRVAHWWAGDAGLTVVHRVQHVHGGIGVDVDYPVHRHFLWGRQLAGTLGGAAATLACLGDVLAEQEVTA